MRRIAELAATLAGRPGAAVSHEAALAAVEQTGQAPSFRLRRDRPKWLLGY